MDKLEKHIRSIREELDYQAPRKDEMWKQISQDMKSQITENVDSSESIDSNHQHEDHHHNHGSKWWTSFVGLVLLTLVLVGIVLGGKALIGPQQQILHPAPPSEALEIDFYYARLAETQIQKLKQNQDLTQEEKDEFLEYISELITEQKELTSKLQHNLDNEELLVATINNFKQQIKLIEQLLERVESRKYKSYESNGIFM